MHIPEDEAERRRLNERGREILRRKNGAVRPHREDGYVNLLNKYGTKQDNSEAYKFEPRRTDRICRWIQCRP